MTERSKRSTPVDDLLADVESYIDDLFQSRLPFALHAEPRWTPPTDVYETEQEFLVTMAIPGMRVEDITVQFERDILRVRGVRREPCGEGRRYHTLEIPLGAFERRVRVRRPIRADATRVAYGQGLLRVVLPKVAQERTEVPID
ncbi:MAG: Hsp20/alpha crystallin family protein [Gemmatimonadota bacterium]